MRALTFDYKIFLIEQLYSNLVYSDLWKDLMSIFSESLAEVVNKSVLNFAKTAYYILKRYSENGCKMTTLN